MRGHQTDEAVTIVGHQRVIDTLVTTYRAGKLSHAYLLEGPAHLGKWTVARAIAGMVLCENGRYPACGSCPSCQAVTSGHYPDLIRVEAEGGAPIPIEKIRSIRSQLALRPMVGKKTVVLIKEVERLTPGAANALLKTLEEPPPYSLFLLTSADSESVFQTIISRCSLIHFYHTDVEEIAPLLVKKYKLTTAVAKEVALISGGLPGRAITFASTGSTLEAFHFTIGLISQLEQQTVHQRLHTIKELTSGQKKLSEQRVLASTILSTWQEALRLAGYHLFLGTPLPSPLQHVVSGLAKRGSNHIVRTAKTFSKLLEYLSQNGQPNAILEYAALSL